MSLENVTTALQAFAASGNGNTLFLREPRFVTFRITGNGSVTAGAVSIECCPQNTPMTQLPVSGSPPAWTVLATILVPPNDEVEYFAGSVSGNFRARISTPVSGGNVTVTAVRPEEQTGAPKRR